MSKEEETTTTGVVVTDGKASGRGKAAWLAGDCEGCRHIQSDGTCGAGGYVGDEVVEGCVRFEVAPGDWDPPDLNVVDSEGKTCMKCSGWAGERCDVGGDPNRRPYSLACEAFELDSRFAPTSHADPDPFTVTLTKALEVVGAGAHDGSDVGVCFQLTKAAVDVGRAATTTEADAFRFAELALDLLKHGTRS